MKKVLKIGAIIFVIVLVISIISSGGNKSQEVKNAFNQGKQDAANNLFTKDQALEKVKNYQLKSAFNTDKEPDYQIPAGSTLSKLYETDGKIPVIQNQGWFTEDTAEKGKFIVGFKQMVSGDLPVEPRWEVTASSIIPLNGKARTLTPELVSTSTPIQLRGSDKENEIFNYSMNLFKQYQKELGDSDQAETRATQETAAKFSITEKEVEDIVYRLNK
ncbi:MAG: hypothetical protein ACOX6N_04465 [Patescibacteria group bacterium]|jgi:hypothetical protein